MKNNLIFRNSAKMSLATNVSSKFFSEFLHSFDGNNTGVRAALSVRDNQGIWHTMTQRPFKNGSIHIKFK